MIDLKSMKPKLHNIWFNNNIPQFIGIIQHSSDRIYIIDIHQYLAYT